MDSNRDNALNGISQSNALSRLRFPLESIANLYEYGLLTILLIIPRANQYCLQIITIRWKQKIHAKIVTSNHHCSKIYIAIYICDILYSVQYKAIILEAIMFWYANPFKMIFILNGFACMLHIELSVLTCCSSLTGHTSIPVWTRSWHTALWAVESATVFALNSAPAAAPKVEQSHCVHSSEREWWPVRQASYVPTCSLLV